MKVLQVNSSDTLGGAARAAHRLHQGLRAQGVDSQMLVQFKRGRDPSVFGPQFLKGEALHKVEQKLDGLPLRLYRHTGQALFSPAWLPTGAARSIASFHPSIVHLHWICAGFLPISALREIRQPVVWTLHDSWAFTGGCHVPFDCLRYRESCGACPQLSSQAEGDLSRRGWNRKKSALQSVNLTVVTPSRWLGDCAKASSLLRDKRVEVIPNGLDLTRYKPVDKKVARDILNLPQDRRLIAFGAVSATSDPNKGFPYLQAAVGALAQQGWREKAVLLVFGADKPAGAPDLGLEVRYLGELRDDVTLALHYSAADVFVAPSMQENLSCTVMEALACGTPCVAFNVGGMPDLIEDGRTGYLAEPFLPEDFARGIVLAVEDAERSQALSRQARSKVEREFALERVAQRYRELYRELVS